MVSCIPGDVGEDFDIGRTGVGHVGIATAFFSPELADTGALIGFEFAHHAFDVLLVAAALVTLRKRVLVDAGEEIIVLFARFGRSRPSCFLRGDPFRTVGHNAFIDRVGLLFHPGNDLGHLGRDVMLLAQIVCEIVQLNSIDASLFHERNHGFIKIEQGPEFVTESICFAIGESPVKHARAKVQTSQFFFEAVSERIFRLLHQAVRLRLVKGDLGCTRGRESVVAHAEHHG